MAITVSGTSITFNDGTTQTTAGGGAPTTAQVLNATAGASVGAVGTYAVAVNTTSTARTPGTTVSGSTLYYSSTGAASQGQTLPGTWRCMCYVNGNIDTPMYNTGLWLRIS